MVLETFVFVYLLVVWLTSLQFNWNIFLGISLVCLIADLVSRRG